MTDPDSVRPPSSAAIYAQPSVPMSRQPSLASRDSRSSLRRPDVHPPASPSTSPQPQNQQPARAAPSPEPEQPPFRPIFALLTSTSHPSQKSTLHHPTVHYVFADDDPELLTEALARHHPNPEDEIDTDYNPDQASPGDGRRAAHGPLSSSATTSRERAILLDLVPSDGGAGPDLEVAWASSLAPDWAVVGARLTSRSGDDDDGDGDRDHEHDRGGYDDDYDGDGRPPAAHHQDRRQRDRDRRGQRGSLIMKIEGVTLEAGPRLPAASAGIGPAPGGASPSEVGGSPSPGLGGPSRQQTQQQRAPSSDEYPAIMSEFEKRMSVLRRVVEAGEERHRKTEADALAAAADAADADAGGVVEAGEGEGEAAREGEGSLQHNMAAE